MKHLLSTCAIVTLAVLSNGLPVMAGEKSEKPTVVELFTSQSCYSCPPAEAYLGELAQKKDLVALEFHVDYWDELVYGAAGKWKDVHSSPKHTERQRNYAARLPDGQSYTPQMVVDGQAFAVGSNRRAVGAAIAKAKKAGHRRLTVAITGTPAAGLRIKIDGDDNQNSAIWLVHYLKAVTTRVRAGENRGKSLTNHNIVTGMTRIGVWRGKPLSLDLAGPILDPGQGCAVVVQSSGQGPIRGAAVCPSG